MSNCSVHPADRATVVRSVDQPIRTVDGLLESSVTHEVVHSLARATVLWMDRVRLEGDFPHLTARTSEKCQAFIESWLLRNAAVISTAQAAQTVANSEISVTDTLRIAHRPPQYGRALVLSTQEGLRGLTREAFLEALDEPPGLLDVKGVGVAPGVSPTCELHRTGLLPLNEAFSELLRQRLVEAVLRHAGVDVVGVPVYGVLNLGFKVKHPSPHIPAAALVRRAHVRYLNGLELPLHGSIDQAIMLQIELVLRRYGLTSTNPTRIEVRQDEDGKVAAWRGQQPLNADPELLAQLVAETGRPLPWELAGVNIQLTRESSILPLQARLIDFGHYQFEPSFDYGLVSLVRDRFIEWGGAIWRDHPEWVQPDPSLMLSEKVLGPQPATKEIAHLAQVEPGAPIQGDRYFGFEMVQRYLSQGLSIGSVEEALEDFVRRATNIEITAAHRSS